MAIVKATEVARAPNYPNLRHNARERKVLETADQYSPANAAVWGAVPPATVTAALDQVAGSSLVKTVQCVLEVVEGVITVSSISIPANALITRIVEDNLVAFDALTSVDIAVTNGASPDVVIVDDLLLATLNTSHIMSVVSPLVKTSAAGGIAVVVTGDAPTQGKCSLFISYIVSV